MATSCKTETIITATPLRGTDVALTLTAKWSIKSTTVEGGHEMNTDFNRLNGPHGLYVHDDGTMYIADHNNDRIVAWLPDGTQGQVLAGGNGTGNELNQLHRPTDVIVDRMCDSLLVCDWLNKRVVCWPRHGGQQGKIVLSNISCACLTMDDRGFLYVSDTEKHEVRRYRIGDDPLGTLVAGGNGDGNDLNQLSFPTYLFIDADHSLYVSDNNNHRVMKWVEGAQQGVVVAGGNGIGSDVKQLDQPGGVLVDRMCTLYVADWGNHRVMRWPQGAICGSVVAGTNDQEHRANQLDRPEGLSFDKHGHLYVVDYGNNRVQKFELLSV